MSANIGVAPELMIEETAVPKFKHGVIIISFLKFKTLVANVKADEPINH